ncbi:MAG: type II CRISPR-associated endonuclease Cas1 [Clostridia bacterium]|nr:type II CRISPR-associated endonuclease Cas1 [Clostridia bacterium]
MGYRSVFIASGVQISVKNSQLLIQGETGGSIPIEDIRTVVIESRTATITTRALSDLTQNGVCVYLCDEKHTPCAVLMPFGTYCRQKKRLLEQLGQSKPRLKQLWQAIIIAKITNQAQTLRLSGCDGDACDAVARLARSVQSGDAGYAEGQAAALYFRALFGDDFSRGKECDVNSALNYGYAIVRGYIARKLADSGLEPCLGIHHASDTNNFNLADDIIEPFRPLVDLYVKTNVREGDGFQSKNKLELCNILNYEMISDGERHSMAYAVERFVFSLTRIYEQPGADEHLCLPSVEALCRHEYE